MVNSGASSGISFAKQIDIETLRSSASQKYPQEKGGQVQNQLETDEIENRLMALHQMKKQNLVGNQDVLSEEGINERETSEPREEDDSGVVKFQRSESANAMTGEINMEKLNAETEVEGGNKNLETPEPRETRNPQELTAEKSAQE